MAGCRPGYFPAVLAALRAVLDPEYNLHGTLATTHPCAPMIMVARSSESAPGVWQFDIRLQGEQETVFFDL
jgi:hypothetical protein